MLRGKVLKRVTASRRDPDELGSPDELVETLAEVFDLDLPEAASLWPAIEARHAERERVAPAPVPRSRVPTMRPRHVNPRFDPVALLGNARPRAVHDPPVRAHAARGDRRLRPTSPAAAGSRGAATGISSSGAPSGGSPPGIVGARVYHLMTSWGEVPDGWTGPFAIWKGGLGVWGGIAAGCVAGAIVARRSGANVALLADCLAPGLLLAQAVGRLGNWWNQELFGRPTDLPWGLEIDQVNRPLAYLDNATFHPTFLYELLWNLLAAALLVFVIERRLQAEAAGPLRRVRRALLLRPVLDRAAARRRGERDPRPARQRLGVADRDRLGDGRLRPHPAPRAGAEGAGSRRGCRGSARRRAQAGPEDGRAAQAAR